MPKLQQQQQQQKQQATDDDKAKRRGSKRYAQVFCASNTPPSPHCHHVIAAFAGDKAGVNAAATDKDNDDAGDDDDDEDIGGDALDGFVGLCFHRLRRAVLICTGSILFREQVGRFANWPLYEWLSRFAKYSPIREQAAPFIKFVRGII
jgi:hypothetical protein